MLQAYPCEQMRAYVLEQAGFHGEIASVLDLFLHSSLKLAQQTTACACAADR
jgi:hypothetical protein